jgi:hypothetical protein
MCSAPWRTTHCVHLYVCLRKHQILGPTTHLHHHHDLLAVHLRVAHLHLHAATGQVEVAGHCAQQRQRQVLVRLSQVREPVAATRGQGGQLAGGREGGEVRQQAAGRVGPALRVRE